MDKYSNLIPEATCHFYNRANGNEKLFLSDDNYLFFIQKYSQYLSIVNTYCYCLMPNHFHFLISIKSEKELRNYFSEIKKEEYDLEKQISNQFSNFFNSYSKAFNKVYNRKGSLFMNSFKRKHITDKNYLKQVIYYIHHNPAEEDYLIILRITNIHLILEAISKISGSNPSRSQPCEGS